MWRYYWNNFENRIRGRWVIHVRTFQHPLGGGAHIEGITESEWLWVTPSNLNNLLKYMFLRYCKKNFENRMRGTKVILRHLQGGLGIHLVLFRIWTTSIHNTKSWYNLEKHVPEVLQKEFWKSNERNESYSRLNLPIPPSRGGVGTHSVLSRIWTASR